MIMADEMRGLLLRFAAIRAGAPRVWPEDEVKRFRKVSPELNTPLPSDARPDELARMAVTYGFAGRDVVAMHYARIAFHKAERMRRIHERGNRSYRKAARGK